jgi:hypothetical protein
MDCGRRAPNAVRRSGASNNLPASSYFTLLFLPPGFGAGGLMMSSRITVCIPIWLALTRRHPGLKQGPSSMTFFQDCRQKATLLHEEVSRRRRAQTSDAVITMLQRRPRPPGDVALPLGRRPGRIQMLAEEEPQIITNSSAGARILSLPTPQLRSAFSFRQYYARPTNGRN